MKNKLTVIISFLIILLASASECLSATQYVNSNYSGDSDGTMAQPWKSISSAQASLSPGDTVYCTGNLGEISLDENTAKGSSTNFIKYEAWSGQSAPIITVLSFSQNGINYYCSFSGFKFIVGPLSEPQSNVVIGGASYVTFENSYFEGCRVGGVFSSIGLSPFSFDNNSIVYSDGRYGVPTNIIFRNNHFKYGYNAIRLFMVSDWLIEGNEIEEFSDNGLQIAYGSSNIVIKQNKIHNGNCLRGSYSWPGTTIATDWENHIGKKVVQDTSGASGLFYGYENGRFRIYLDDMDAIPVRSTSYPWRLSETPGNIFFTPSGTGDNNHTDLISIEGNSDNIDVVNNYLYESIGGHLLKVGWSGGSATNLKVYGNLFYEIEADTYLIRITTGEVYFFNNTVDVFSSKLYYYLRGIRVEKVVADQDLKLYLHNNLISGGVWDAGTVVSDYNIWAAQPPEGFNSGSNDVVLGNSSAEPFTGLFANRESSEYDLAANSLAKKSGAKFTDFLPVELQAGINKYNSDISGAAWNSPPSIGCYDNYLSRPTGLHTVD